MTLKPSATIGLDCQDATLQFGVGHVPQPLFEGFQETVGEAFEG